MALRAILALCFTFAVLNGFHTKECDPSLRFQGRQFKEVVIGHHSDTTTDLVASTVSGDVIYNEVVPRNEDQFKMKLLKSGQTVAESINFGTVHPQAVTLDKDNDELYFGTTSGIYKLDKATNTPKLWKEDGKDIPIVTYANNALYYTEFPGFVPYKYVLEGGEYKKLRIEGLSYTDGLIADRQGNLYFANEDAQFMKLPHGTIKAVPITGIPAGDKPTAAVITITDDVLIATGKKLFVVAKGDTVAHHHNDYDSPVNAFFVDKNGILYAADENSLLKYVEDTHCKL